MRWRLAALEASPLAVPLREPFVIATGRVDETRAALVRVAIEVNGWTARGFGEAACLPPVTREDRDDAIAAAQRAAERLVDSEWTLSGETPPSLGPLGDALDELLPEHPVARAGIETALLDALARSQGVPLHALLGSGVSLPTMVTDMTLPIAAASRMGELARHWRALGFRHLKVKVGRSHDDDVAALDAIAKAAPDAILRLDGNEGCDAAEAIALVARAESAGLSVELFEQPCPRGDLDAMAEVARSIRAPVVADESARRPEDVAALARAGAAGGVNLKLVKSGGPLGALDLARAARAHGLKVMVGGMVETRLGMTAAAHVAAAVGADWCDLDTAWLLAEDPWEGGYVADGERYELPPRPGLGVILRPRNET